VRAVCYCFELGANCDGVNGRTDEVPKEKSVRCFHSNMYGSNYALHKVSFVRRVILVNSRR
jgi:hypothetical protein